jgi:NAD(P)-dependent dehydrogenase (short-subunit alcohol dehydrogenase family)
VLEIDEQEWDAVMRVNVRGAFQCVKAAVPQMRAHGSGKIINISSSTVFAGVPRMLHYVSSKGALVAMTRALARELGPDRICVNSLALGLTLSERVAANPEFQGRRDANLAARALKRDQQMDDCIGAAVYLGSAESDFMTGQNIVIDGGVVMR